MLFGFRKVRWRCGAELVMVPRLLHPYHMRVYIKGPRAALAKLADEATWIMIGLTVLAFIGKFLVH